MTDTTGDDSDAWVFCPLAPETRRRFPDDWDDGGARCTCGRDRQVLAVLGHLAALYADHPDYQQEWRSALDDSGGVS